MNDTELVEEIQNRTQLSRAVVRTYSFGEIASMYEVGELTISPDYQRLFRWSDEKQSQFIESLLLELPLPPLFMIQRPDETYELVDGLQRVSTYLRFTGLLKGAGNLAEELKTRTKGELSLKNCDIVHSLNGRTYKTLPTALHIRLRRSAVNVAIIQLGSDTHLRYYMFKRLNSGGEKLSDHESRSGFTRMFDAQAVDFIVQLSQNRDFMICTSSITEDSREKRFDQELVLRFLAITIAPNKFRHDVEPFLTEFLESIAFGERDYESMQVSFELVFSALASSIAEQSFTLEGKNQFSVLHFEGIAGGVAMAIKENKLPDPAKLEERIRALKKDSKFLGVAKGGGKNSSKQLNDRINIAYGFITGNDTK